MNYSIARIIEVTVVSMGIVFIVLTGMMLLMWLVSWVATRINYPESNIETNISTKDLLESDEYARAAVICALIEASRDQPNKHFKIEKIEKITEGSDIQ